MTQIKICGITNEEDAMCAAKCGADALGFIFYPQSPRYILPVAAAKIIAQLPADIACVGVFVNETAAEVKRIANLCNLDFIQLHGDESAEYCQNFPQAMLIKAIDLQSDTDLANALSCNVAAILVDSRHAGLYGGTGKKANWDLALRVKSQKPLILSGGLNEENVSAAVSLVAPQALDVNSGVELTPGKKDHQKLARLVAVIRRMEEQTNETTKIFSKRKK